MKSKTIFYGLLLLLLCSFSILTPVSATTPLHFTYTQSQDQVKKDYIFTITFSGSEEIYGVNMTFGHHKYVLQPAVRKNEYYLSSTSSLQGLQVELAVTSSLGYNMQSFTVHLTGQSKSMFSTPLFNDLLALTGLVLLIGLVAKYVLFYTDKKSKE